MDPSGVPDPLRADSVPAFIAQLRLLKVWAGNPSFHRLARLSGVPRSTLADAVSGRRSGLPTLDVVRGFVRACGVDDAGLVTWEAAWRRLQPVGMPNPTGTEPPARTVPAGERIWPVPALLPADSADFVGRDKQLAQLTALLRPVNGDEPAAIPIVAITGQAGVGKTSLALHVAHRLAGQFPDGQLYVNLRDANGEPVDPASVLGRFLRVLGLDSSAVPAGLEERAELFRGLLATRRMLVVLDNTQSAAQIRPLLPGSATCAVLVTSRFRLADLTGMRRLDLEILEQSEALQLLATVAGPERVADEPEAAEEIVRLCGYLPLAVRIAAARLAARPHQRLAWLVGRLADRRRRLGELAVGDLDVRGSLALSYQALPAAAARALRLLAVLDAPTFAAWVAAPLLEVDLVEAEDLVDALADAYLLDIDGTDATGQVRYRFHDLVRIFARERSGDEDTDHDRRAAVRRAAGAWLDLADLADARVPPRERPPIRGDAPRYELPADERDRLLNEPLAWFDAERGSLVAVVEQCLALGLDSLAWELVGACGNLLDLRGHYDDAERLYGLAAQRCRAVGDELGEATMLLGLGVLWANGPESSEDRQLEAASRAIELFDRLGERLGKAKALESMAYTHERYGRPDESLRLIDEALAIGVEDHPDLLISLWITRGFGCLAKGDYPECEASYLRALDLSRRYGSRVKEALVLRALGSLCRRLGDLQQARTYLRQALVLLPEFDYASVRAAMLMTLGQIQVDIGDPEAGATLEQALAECRRLGVAFGQGLVLGALGDLYRTQGRIEEALAACAEALQIARSRSQPVLLALVLKSVGHAHYAAGDQDAAHAAWQEARDLHANLGNLVEAEALDRLLANGPPATAEG